MATVLLATGNTQVASADFTLAADTNAFVYLTSAGDDHPYGMRLLLQVKDGATYHTIARPLDSNNPGEVFNPGSVAIVARLLRVGTGGAIGASRP